MNRSLREPARDIPTVGEFDVAVVGGGTAGVMAAVGASRAGAKTCLVERSGTLGGALSVGIVGHFYNRFRDGEGRDLVGGAPRELLERLVASGGTPYGDVEEALGNVRIFFRHEYAGVVCLQMVREAGVDLWLQTRFCRALPAPDGGYDLFIECKDGRKAVRAREVVDCSSEADVAASLGAPINSGPSKSWGLIFEIAHFDEERYRAFLETCDPECPEWTEWLARYLGMTVEELREDYYWKEWVDGQRRAWLWRPRIMEAVEAGDFDLLRDLPGGGQVRYGWDGFWPEPWHGQGTVHCNVCMVTGLDPGLGVNVTKAEVAARSYAFDFLDFLRKYIPGFENAVIRIMAGQTMSRGGREIIGESSLRARELAKDHVREDAVCLANLAAVALPLGMFCPKGVDDLLVAGKCAEGGYGVRASVTCMAAGYSCGIVAALAAEDGVTPMRLDMPRVHEELKARGVILEMGDPAPGAVKLSWPELPGVPDFDDSHGTERAKKLS